MAYESTQPNIDVLLCRPELLEIVFWYFDFHRRQLDGGQTLLIFGSC